MARVAAGGRRRKAFMSLHIRGRRLQVGARGLRSDGHCQPRALSGALECQGRRHHVEKATRTAYSAQSLS